MNAFAVTLKKICFDCYEDFIKVYARIASGNSIELKSLFTIDLIYRNRHLKEIYNKIVISSIFDEYLILQNAYRLIFKTNFRNFEKFRKFFFNIGISLADNRPKIMIIFKEDFNLSKEIHSYKALIPSNVKLVIVDKNYNYENEIIDSNNLVVYLKSSLLKKKG